jgi:hypothetical protein
MIAYEGPGGNLHSGTINGNSTRDGRFSGECAIAPRRITFREKVEGRITGAQGTSIAGHPQLAAAPRVAPGSVHAFV